MSPLDHVLRLGAILDSLSVPWVLGGSLASSLIGEPRSTLDVDLAVLLDVAQLDSLIDAVAPDYYVDAPGARDAVRDGGSFNLIDFATGLKVDLFPLTSDPLDRRQLVHRERVELSPGVEIWVGAPIDQVLRKLRWFRLGGEVSDRQWRDVLAILRVQGDGIDRAELVDAAEQLDLGDLARRAIADADTGQ